MEYRYQQKCLNPAFWYSNGPGGSVTFSLGSGQQLGDVGLSEVQAAHSHLMLNTPSSSHRYAHNKAVLSHVNNHSSTKHIPVSLPDGLPSESQISRSSSNCSCGDSIESSPKRRSLPSDKEAITTKLDNQCLNGGMEQAAECEKKVISCDGEIASG
ncbi:unnamed protein product [Trichobilharzia regenti]|nr:unnamed protein product [Trichobilharzia regenti]